MTLEEIKQELKNLRESRLELHGKIYSILLKQGIKEAELFSQYGAMFSDIAFMSYRQGVEEVTQDAVKILSKQNLER